MISPQKYIQPSRSMTRQPAMHRGLCFGLAALSVVSVLAGCKKPRAEEPLAIETLQTTVEQGDSTRWEQRRPQTSTVGSAATSSADASAANAARGSSDTTSGGVAAGGSRAEAGGSSGGRLADRLAANERRTGAPRDLPGDEDSKASLDALNTPATQRETELNLAEGRKILGIAESLVKIREFDLPTGWDSPAALPSGDPLREVVGTWVQTDASKNNGADFHIGGYDNQVVLLTNAGELWSIRSGATGNQRQVGYRVKVDGSTITLVELIGGESPLSKLSSTWVGADGQAVKIEPAVARVPHRLRHDRRGDVLRLGDREFRYVPATGPAGR